MHGSQEGVQALVVTRCNTPPLLEFAHVYPYTRRFPLVIGFVRKAVFPEGVFHLSVCFDFFQDPNNLTFTASTCFHGRFFSSFDDDKTTLSLSHFSGGLQPYRSRSPRVTTIFAVVDSRRSSCWRVPVTSIFSRVCAGATSLCTWA